MTVGRVLGVEAQPVGPLSVADVQHVMRHLLGRQTRTAGGDMGEAQPGVDVTPAPSRSDAARQVSVIAGHPGAGSSTVALALADAAAASGQSVHLLDPASPGRSGLVAAAAVELGTDPTGTWRRGRRTSIVIERRAFFRGESTVVPSEVYDDELTVLDLGCSETTTARATPTIVVCRANVPGIRLVEQRLEELAGRPLLVAAVGPHGWAREVRASVGPRLTALQDTALVVNVPWDSRLDVTGLTDRPLPRPVVAAGAQLLSSIDTARRLLALDGRAAQRCDR